MAGLRSPWISSTAFRPDNTKAYWSAHKALYEASVRTPMAELLSELYGEFGHGRIARPYRDMRFRAAKSPYKTEIYATFERGGYVRLGADGLTAASGYFMMSAAQLDRYRQAADRDTEGVQLALCVPRISSTALTSTVARPGSAGDDHRSCVYGSSSSWSRN